MKNIKFLLLLTISLSIFSCSTSVIEEVIITAPITYNVDVKVIIDNNCISCHGGTSPSAGLNLETYTSLRNSTENGNLLTRINSASNPMPQGGKMSPDLIATIEEWANQGYLEN